MVRERYPRFVDALSDLDDALTLTYLFAAIPSEMNIKANVTNKAKTLAAAWGAYCATASCITKSFISVKGVYLEAMIRDTPVRWIVPHSFTQYMPEDVDYRVMTTFFEFYETLLQFVLFKLYNDLGVRYPLPTVDAGVEVKGSTSSVLGANLRSLRKALDLSSSGAISKVVSESVEDRAQVTLGEGKTREAKKKSRELLKTVGEAISGINEESDNENDDKGEDDVDVTGPLKAALESMNESENSLRRTGHGAGLEDDAVKRTRLFSGLTFFLSREIPRGYLELVLLAYGGEVGWEGPNSPIAVDDPSITHHLVDRPKLLPSYASLPQSREFVQPQWVLDCANFMFILPISKYAIGRELPPHLSPWVDDEEEGYKPAYAEEIERLKNGETVDMKDDAAASDTGTSSDADVDQSTPKEKEEAVEASGSESSSDEDGGEDDNDSSDDEKAKARKAKKRLLEVSHDSNGTLEECRINFAVNLTTSF